MSEAQAPARPQVRRRSGPSIVWLIPAVTLIFGGWLIVRTLSDQGPQAQISFRTAEGIEAGKTRVKYKSVDIGVVEAVRFADDFARVVLTVQFEPGTAHFLKRNTRFWVVRPQLSVRGVSGLGTLVSGAYIEIDPGPGAEQRYFEGIEEQPVVAAGEEGTRITLVADELGSVDTGSPLYYRGIQAGEVLGHELGSDRRSVYIHVFVRDPFDQLVRGNSRFWNVSGMDVSMSADGFDVHTASVQSLLFGGIAFETPESVERSEVDVGDLVYTLHPDRAAIAERSFTRRLTFVLYFDGSVRGLGAGAPVEFKGIRIGEVTDVRLEFDVESTSFRIPVLVEIEPERIIDRGETRIPPEQVLSMLVEQGLRARLQTGSLLTGQLYVELNMYPETDIELLADADMPYPELPTIPNTVQALTRRIESIEIDAIAAALQETLENASALSGSEGLATAVDAIGPSMRALEAVLGDLEAGELDRVLAAARKVVADLETTIRLANEALDPDAPLQYDVRRLTEELSATARTVRAFVESMERRPQQLILGRPRSREDDE